MLRQSNFWDRDGDATILLRNHDLFTADGNSNEKFFDVAQKWLSSAGVTASDIKVAAELLDRESKSREESGEEFDRIFLRDSERAFKSDEARRTMMTILSVMQAKLGDYHQGMGLIGAFFLLLLSPPEVLALLTKMAEEEKYIPNAWKAQSIASATDGYVFMMFMKSYHRDVYDHFKAVGLLPETYVQKWFVSLNIHVLPFSALFPFFTRFFEVGFPYMFQFGLSLVQHFEQTLLRTDDISSLYEVLRLDYPKSELVQRETACAVVEDVKIVETYKVADKPFAELREHAFEFNLKDRIQSANKSHQEVDDEEVTFKCEFCQGKAENWCVPCKVFLCDACRDKDPPPGKHDEDEHLVVEAEDKEEFDEEEEEEDAAAVAQAQEAQIQSIASVDTETKIETNESASSLSFQSSPTVVSAATTESTVAASREKEESVTVTATTPAEAVAAAPVETSPSVPSVSSADPDLADRAEESSLLASVSSLPTTTTSGSATSTNTSGSAISLLFVFFGLAAVVASVLFQLSRAS